MGTDFEDRVRFGSAVTEYAPDSVFDDSNGYPGPRPRRKFSAPERLS